MESPMPERQVMTRPACFALSRISPISPSVAEVSVMPAYAFTTIQRSVRHELGWSAPPGSIGLHTRIAVRLDLSSADDDPRLIFTDHQTARRQCCALPDGSYSRGWCWPNDISHLSVRHELGWSAPPGSIGLHTRIAVRLDLSSADDDPRLIFTDHQTARRQCCALPDGSYSRGWCWPNDISHLWHDMDCWWMTIDPRGHPPSIPVIVHPRAAQHQT